MHCGINLAYLYDRAAYFVMGFRRVRKIVKSYYYLRHVRHPSVCLSVRPHGTTRLPLDGFWWNLIFEFCRKYIEKIQVSLKFDKNNGYVTWRRFHVYENIPLNSSYNKKCFRENQIRHFIFNNFFFFWKFPRLWDNVEKCGGPIGTTNDVTIWRTRVACWISKASRTHAHTDQYVILIAFPRQQWFDNAPQC